MTHLVLLHNITTLPKASSMDEVARWRERMAQQSENSGDTLLAEFVRNLCEDSKGIALLDAIFGNSPYLSRLALQHLAFTRVIIESGIDPAYIHIRQLIKIPVGGFVDENALKKHLRVTKEKLALLTAIADITQLWPLEQVTAALAEFAESCLNLVCDFLLMAAYTKKELQLDDPQHPSKGSGLIVLGMGKLGARELNYSSDIDLIIFFEREKTRYTGKQSVQQCFARLAQDLVRIMQDRTEDGYVFRTDLRLRPDPASTPLALSTNGAMTYYETVGQNWERAALIKARPVGGDYDAGYEFLKQIAPFIWRKSLDFAAIADIHSLKRQMDSKTGGAINLYGHNIKIGVGGIREIEFFVQIHQLIWGGRKLTLRTNRTCDTLNALVSEQLLAADICEELKTAYRFFRRVEHHLQMIADQQTHNLPDKPEDMKHLATFLGFDSPAAFENELSSLLMRVHEIYANSFQTSQSLGEGGNLVFTGVDNDPGTMETLSQMGFSQPGMIAETIAGWHRGNRRATRTKRARELITEITPALLHALASTPNPDAAFLKFDEFLKTLPAGVQLFSLFQVNPQLLTLLALIMGGAPSIAEDLSKNPSLLDVALLPEFFSHTPNQRELQREFEQAIFLARDYDDEKYILRRFKSEKHFQVGVQLLKRLISATQAGHMLSLLAEMILSRTQAHVISEYTEHNGTIANADFCVVAMGRLGARELTFGSDLDLIFIYDAPPDATSDGDHAYGAAAYYNRLCPRYINSLSSRTKDGRLYEVDTRLRPSGKDGPMAVSIEAFEKYMQENAWTFEYMALTRARPVTGSTKLQLRIETIISSNLLRKRDMATLVQDVQEMRKKVWQEFSVTNPFDIKYVRGGLMDIDFIGQYLLLRHAPDHPEILKQSTREIFTALHDVGLMDDVVFSDLMTATELQTTLFSLLRLCNQGVLVDGNAPAGLTKLLTDLTGEPTFELLKLRLVETQKLVLNYFNMLVA